MRILISNNPEKLAAALSGTNSATVEAEYGSTLVKGSILTLAHHGARASRPCPCSLGNMPEMGIEVIGVSHFDLDTLGGVMAIMGRKPERYDVDRAFWAAAATVDINGVHKLDPNKYFLGESWILPRLHAFWAWSESNRLFPERDGTVTDVTEFFNDAMGVVEALFYREPKDDSEDPRPELQERQNALLQSGRDWAEAKAQLDVNSLIETIDGVQLRSSDSFVNHLYGADTRAIVGYSTKFKSITVSVPDAVEGFSCGTFLQGIFGPKAGGHAGIGGTPRGVEYTLSDAREVAVKLAETLA